MSGKMPYILRDAPMPIVTERLVLRPLQEGDGASLCAAKNETWDQLTKIFQWANGTPDSSQDEIYARRSYANYILRDDFNLVGTDKNTGDHLLYIGLHPLNWSIPEFQIGYWVRKQAQQAGYATEAAKAVLSYAFNQLDANRLVMCHVEGNKASQKIITSLGLSYEGPRKNSLLFAGGVVRDAHWYSIVDSEKVPKIEASWC